MTLGRKVAAALQRQWWRRPPAWPAVLLQPLAWVVQRLAGLHRWQQQRQATALPVPVLVVGNLIVGGAGKTPTVMALIHSLRTLGWRPGVVSRGYGRRSDGLLEVNTASTAQACGDEPLLIYRRTGVPVMVGRDRHAAACALLQAHPDINLLVADDGMQHWRLPRDLEVLVFDGRGAGNGLTLPAGPLRQPLPTQLPAHTLVLYNANQPSTPLPGYLAQRRLGAAVPLRDWWQGRPAVADSLLHLAQRSQQHTALAAAGMADPERFFSMLESAGIAIRRLPLPDHADLHTLPWSDDETLVLVTEKDAVKLDPTQPSAAAVQVLTLDFELPPSLTAALDDLLRSIAMNKKP